MNISGPPPAVENSIISVMLSGCLLRGWRDCKMQIRQLQTVGSQGLEEFPVVLWAYQAIFWTMREMWETQWLPYRASLFSPEPPSVQCCHAGEFTKAGHLRLGDDHSTSTRHSSSLHKDLIRVVSKVLPLQSTVRLKTKFPCWEFTRRLTVYPPTFTWILEGRITIVTYRRIFPWSACALLSG